MAVLDGTMPDAAAPIDDKKAASSADEHIVDPADAELVKKWLKRIKKAKERHKTAFKQMRDNDYLATHGATKEWRNAKNYTIAILNRHINMAVAQLYARDPVATAKPRKKMRYTVWDGRPDTLQAAAQMAPTGDPQAQAIIQDVLQARAQEQLIAKSGETLEILWSYFTQVQDNGFKKQMKALVRRTKVDCVGYIKLAFQRALEPRPEIAAKIEDATSQLATTERLIKKNADGDIEAQSAEASELKSLLAQLQDQLYLVVREGPVFDFPAATRVIIDPQCKHLKTLTGARWIAHQFDLDDDEIEEIYGIDLRKIGGASTGEEDTQSPDPSMSSFDQQETPKHGTMRSRTVYEVQDKRDSQFLTVCEGYEDFLKRPGEPEVKIDRFFTIFPLVFNEIESEDELYPPSDVELLLDTTNEMNRARQGMREHRQANRPKYAAAAGMLADEDREKLVNHQPNAVLELKALKPDADISKLVQRFPMVAIDPAQYDTQELFSDMERIVGTQQANLGTGSNTTATETSIVEAGRQAGISDALDDLDELLSDVALATGQLLLLEMSVEMVKQIVGAGAVWPDAPPSRQEISENLYLDVKAGSSGRPNKGVELSNLERVVPLLLQVPGIDTKPIVRKIELLLDMDPQEMDADNLPSTTALNAMMVKMQQQPAPAMPGQAPAPPPGAGPPQAHTGAPGAGPQPVHTGAPSPAMQGPAGATNAPHTQTITPGAQPGMTQQTLPEPPH